MDERYLNNSYEEDMRIMDIMSMTMTMDMMIMMML